MPTYEYQCAKCGEVFDKFQSMTEPALTVCPKDLCARSRWGKGKVQRVMSGGAGLIFKGSGFYITDYRSENYKAGAKKDSSTTSSPASATPSGDKGKSSGEKAPAKSSSAPSKPVST
jgi:putative FmdB family regulatory protein